MMIGGCFPLLLHVYARAYVVAVWCPRWLLGSPLCPGELVASACAAVGRQQEGVRRSLENTCTRSLFTILLSLDLTLYKIAFPAW